jgi:predicted TIM-barrel fold metal-dependent hydrolase
VLEAFGPERLMWGSDCPYQLAEGHGYGRSLALIQSGLDFLNADAQAQLLQRTAERVFFS